MRMRITTFACLLVAAVQAQDPAATPINTAPAPLSTACGDIINNATRKNLSFAILSLCLEQLCLTVLHNRNLVHGQTGLRLPQKCAL